jgi:predicted transcriptional regulator of viral defense system
MVDNMDKRIIRTLGRTSAGLITELYNEHKLIFTIKDVERITGLNYFSAGRLVSELTKRKIISTLKKGIHIIIPQELGSIDSYSGNWYIVAREIANSPHYYIAFYSAMRYWGMTTQPLLKIFVATPIRQVVPKALKQTVIFVFVDKSKIWGVTSAWVTKTEKANLSNIEKTIIDAVAHPEYCGGMTEVAKGIWLAKDRIDYKLLLSYVQKYGKNVVAKRIGYILELTEIGPSWLLDALKKYVRLRYDIFDPTMGKRAIKGNSWRLLDNVGAEQIRKILQA